MYARYIVLNSFYFKPVEWIESGCYVSAYCCLETVQAEGLESGDLSWGQIDEERESYNSLALIEQAMFDGGGSWSKLHNLPLIMKLVINYYSWLTELHCFFCIQLNFRELNLVHMHGQYPKWELNLVHIHGQYPKWELSNL